MNGTADCPWVEEHELAAKLGVSVEKLRALAFEGQKVLPHWPRDGNRFFHEGTARSLLDEEQLKQQDDREWLTAREAGELMGVNEDTVGDRWRKCNMPDTRKPEVPSPGMKCLYSRAWVDLVIEDEARKRKATVTLCDIKDRWGEVPGELKRMGRLPVGAFIREAKPTMINGKTLTLTFPDKFEFHHRQISGPYKLVAEEAIARVFGVSLSLNCEFAKHAVPSANDGQWLTSDEATEALGLSYPVSSWWQYHKGGYERRSAPEGSRKYLYPRKWVEEQREYRSSATGKKTVQGTYNTDGRTFLTPEAMRKFKADIRHFLTAHPGVTSAGLSRACGMNESYISCCMRQDRTRKSYATNVRRVMREWDSETQHPQPPHNKALHGQSTITPDGVMVEAPEPEMRLPWWRRLLTLNSA